MKGLKKKDISALSERCRKISEKYKVSVSINDMVTLIELSEQNDREFLIMAFEIGLERGYKAGVMEGWRKAQESWEL